MTVHMYYNVQTNIQVNPVTQWGSFDAVKKTLALKVDSPHAVAGNLPSESATDLSTIYSDYNRCLRKRGGRKPKKGAKTSQRWEQSQQITLVFFISNGSYWCQESTKNDRTYLELCPSPWDATVFLQQKVVTVFILSLSCHEVLIIDVLLHCVKVAAAYPQKPSRFQLPVLNLHKVSGMLACKTLPDSWTRFHLWVVKW